jgi:hypothetical protein
MFITRCITRLAYSKTTQLKLCYSKCGKGDKDFRGARGAKGFGGCFTLGRAPEVRVTAHAGLRQRNPRCSISACDTRFGFWLNVGRFSICLRALMCSSEPSAFWFATFLSGGWNSYSWELGVKDQIQCNFFAISSRSPGCSSRSNNKVTVSSTVFHLKISIEL